MRAFAPCPTTIARAVLAPLVGAASVLLAGGTAVAAASPAPHGDNGDVKIHRSTTDPTDTRNEPKVCAFYLVAFGFDADHDLNYEIVKAPPFKGPAALSGDIDVNDHGYGRTADLELPDGH